MTRFCSKTLLMVYVVCVAEIPSPPVAQKQKQKHCVKK